MNTKAEILRYVRIWEQRCYSDGIPDEAPKEIDDIVPSWKRICLAILRGDLEIIGIVPPQSQYYGMLKAIELNKEYKPRMTQIEQKQSALKLINELVEKNCYIKGYGDKFRVCDEYHNPLKNITKQETEIMKENNIVRGNGLIYVLNVTRNPYSSYGEIILPRKD